MRIRGLGLPIQMLNGPLGCDCTGDNSLLSGIGSYGKEIKWDTEPVINTYSWNRDGFWDCNDWKTWHSKIEAKYGTARANEVFMTWWNKQGTFAYAQDCYLFNQDFRNWWKSKKLPSETLTEFVTNSFDFITGAQDNILDAGGNVIANTANAASSVTKTASWLIPTLLVAAGAAVVYVGYKRYVKPAADGKKLKLAGHSKRKKLKSSK
jgi:hypothetical protein